MCSLTRALQLIETSAYTVLASGSEPGKNGLIAFGRAVHPLLVIAGSADVVRILAGDPNPDTLRTALLYLRDNADAIAAFTATDPQLNGWLAWLMGRTKELLAKIGVRL